MHDRWLESFDNGEISAVLTLDMSAAFDLVDHNVLLEKLRIYKIGSAAANCQKNWKLVLGFPRGQYWGHCST